MSDRIQNEAIQNLRENYQSGALLLSQTPADPFTLFDRWFKAAVEQKITEPNAMILATADQSGFPSARVVLLKEYDRQGFIFYTNYQSRKGQELAENPACCLVFNWLDLHQQIRIEGHAEPLPASESTAYFQSRPKGSQIGAWTSPQSEEIKDRATLEERYQSLTQQYKDETLLPRPEHWGGYLIKPRYIEFWQGRESRLHDRIFYRLNTERTWEKGILAP